MRQNHQKDRKLAYQKSFRKHGVSPKSLQWHSYKSIELRFKQIISNLNFNNKSILDIGCGFGFLIPCIEKQAKNFNYLGVDIVPEFIKEARRLYPNQDFKICDYFTNPLKEKFDIIIVSGVLNNNLGKKSLKNRFEFIEKTFEKCKKTLAFNMAGACPQPKNSNSSKVYYANSLEVLNFCFSLTKKLIFTHKYRPRDFTLILFK